MYNRISRPTMDQLVHVLLALDEAHSTTECPRLQTRITGRWVKQCLCAQLSHSLCLEYLASIAVIQIGISLISS